MIIDRPESWYVFIFSTDDINCPSNDPGSMISYQGQRLTNKEYLEYWGKWVFFGSEEGIGEMAKKLNPYVENHQIPCIKYDRAPQKWFDLDQCVMCVYCDHRQRDDVLLILSEHGVKIKAWTYDREVIEKWLPGGLHLEKWIEHHNLSEEDAEKIRDESTQKYQKNFFDRPDAICRGWNQ